MKTIHNSMKPFLSYHAIALVSLVILTTTSHAAVIVNYTFLDLNVSQTSGVATGSDVTLGSFTGASGASAPYQGFSSTTDTIFVRENATGNLDVDGDTLTEALTNNAYAGFTLTNTTGSSINLESLTYNIWFTTPVSTTTYQIAVLTDAAGSFDAGDMLETKTFLGSSAPTSAGSQLLQTNNISSLGVLANGASMQFRLYFMDDGDTASAIFRVDDLTVNGTLIPEPSAVLLGSLGMMLLFRRRR